MTEGRARPNERQLVFDLATKPDLSRQALIEARCNELAIAWIDRWPDWPAPALIIHGPPSSGKSHLLGVWAKAAGAVSIDSRTLGREPRPRDVKTVVIDDIEAIVGDRAAEETVFHLYNDLHGSGGSMLLTAGSPVGHWPLVLPDLATRLRAAPQVSIGAPDDEALRSILRKQLSDRQLSVADEDLNYAIWHIERSFKEAARFATFLNRVSIRDRRKITRRFIASVTREFVAE